MASDRGLVGKAIDRAKTVVGDDWRAVKRAAKDEVRSIKWYGRAAKKRQKARTRSSR